MVIPRSVTNIGGGAFSNMTSLEKIYIWNSNSGYRMLYNSNKAVIYTLAGTPAYEFARNNKYDVKGYTDEEVLQRNVLPPLILSRVISAIVRTVTAI